MLAAMTLRHLIYSIFCGLLFVGLAAAQLQPPVFDLVAANCNSDVQPQPCYTAAAPVGVNVTYPTSRYSGLEFCITEQGTLNKKGRLTYCETSSNWEKQVSPYTLSAGNGLKTVYLEWRYWPYTANISTPGSQQIFLDESQPSITLNSPMGLPNAASSGNGAQQALSTSAQFITGSISLSETVPPPGDPITVTLYSCNAANGCATTPFDTIQNVAPPYAWGSAVPSGTTYINATATNMAGTSGSTNHDTPVFSVFAPGSLAQLVCSPSTPDFCPTLTISGDSPSPGVPTSDKGTITFQGYADPSMRRDPVVSQTNPNGTNLWMLYSYPEVQSGQCPPTGCTSKTVASVVEIHLASSSDGGFNWTGCTPAPCSNATPIWPSVWTGQTYSSHEVSNLWPYEGNWYAVHLMYFVALGATIESSIADGCLVTTVAATPAGLGTGWADNPPASCPVNGTPQLPSGNNAISYKNLTTWAQTQTPGLACQSWGEPAIMVNGDNGGTAYLAASCMSLNFVNNGYYIFKNTDLTLTDPWSYYAGPFNLSNLPDASTYESQGATFLTEFDWAARSDNGATQDLVAVVTPAGIVQSPGPGEKQFGCVAVGFTLQSGPSSPFGAVVATVTDQDPLGGGKTPPTENNYGPNACTYEPTSNTGVLIVRKVLNGQYDQVYSLIGTGLMP